MGWYRVVKTIKGHRYVYLQRTWREGKHVRTESRYVGPADAGCRTPGKRENRPESQPEPVNTTRALTSELVEETFAELLKSRPALLPSVKPWDKTRTGENLVMPVEAVLEKLKVKRTSFKKHAYYGPEDDRMNIQPQQTFIHFFGETAIQPYCATLFHELSHWTGHRSRLGRASRLDFILTSYYACEELVAEATAMLLMKHFGIASRDISRHADYFQGWLLRTANHDEALVYAKREAERAARFILGVNTTDA
jgi:antirestriction protein ArdC